MKNPNIVLAEFLKNHDAGMWERSSEQLKQDLAVELRKYHLKTENLESQV